MNYLYAPESVIELQSIYQDLYKVIGSENRLAMFHEIKGLSARLKNFNNPEIIILLSVKKHDLLNIIAIKDLFLDAAVILLLSDEDQAMFDLAICLRAKYVGVMNGDIDKIIPIVQKLIQKKHRSSPNTRQPRARSLRPHFDFFEALDSGDPGRD